MTDKDKAALVMVLLGIVGVVVGTGLVFGFGAACIVCGAFFITIAAVAA